MSFTMEQAEAQVEQLMEEGRQDEALAVCRRIADELHEEPEPWQVLDHVTPDTEQLRAEDTGSSLWLLGQMHYMGRGGMEETRRRPSAATAAQLRRATC